MTILVTGASGQIGSELLRASTPHHLVGMNRAGLDITDAAAVAAIIRQHDIRVLINTAAYTAVDRAETEAELAWACNRDGAAVLATVCAEAGIPLFHLSTDYVFSGELSRPWREDDVAQPRTVYGQSKYAGEQEIRQRLHQHLILRLSWVFGGQGQNFVKSLLQRAQTQSILPVVADQQGAPTPAREIAAALLQLADRYLQGEPLLWGTYHFTGSPATSWYGFAQVIVRKAHARGLLAQLPDIKAIESSAWPAAAVRPHNSRLDCQRACNVLGLSQPSWEAGLDRLLDEWEEVPS